MVDDSKGKLNDAAAPAMAKPAKGKVDLFPALADRKMMPINSIRQPVPSHVGTQISIFSPVSFDEALDIVECLRGRAATTISLDNMKKWDASRLVDFVAGASAALDGDFHKLSEQVYLFCPSNMKITAATKVSSKGPTTQGINSLDFLYPDGGDNQVAKTFAGWPSN
jgi:FtsZ-interacting cell division protein YlmF